MIVAYGMIKLSVLFFYRRIFVTRSRSMFDIATKATGVLLVIWMAGFLLISLFGCGKHFDYGWGPLMDEYRCVSNLAELNGLVITDFATDLMVILLPFPIVGPVEIAECAQLTQIPLLNLDLEAQHDDQTQAHCYLHTPARSFVSLGS